MLHKLKNCSYNGNQDIQQKRSTEHFAHESEPVAAGIGTGNLWVYVYSYSPTHMTCSYKPIRSLHTM